MVSEEPVLGEVVSEEAILGEVVGEGAVLGEVVILFNGGAVLEEGLVKGRYYHLGTVPVVFQVLLVCNQ